MSLYTQSVLASAAISLAITPAIMAQGCEPRLRAGPITSMTGDISAMVSADDGRGGKAIYFGGTFSSINGRSINRIARWWPGTGEIDAVDTWQGAAIPSGVSALHEFTDSTGTAIFAATSNGVWKLVGDSWIRTVGLNGIRCDDFTIAHMGGADRLVVAAHSASSPAWMWTGATWTPIGAANTSSLCRSIAALPSADGDDHLLLGNVHPVPLIWNGTDWIQTTGPGILSAAVWLRTDVLALPGSTGAPANIFMVGPQGGQQGGIWRMDSNEWSNVGRHQLPSYLFAMEVFDFGLGQGPQITLAGWGVYARRGEDWTNIINGLPSGPRPLGQSGRIYAMKAHRASALASQVLVVGGLFQVENTGAINLAYIPSCLPCAADFNASSSVTIDDLLGFLQAWFSGSTTADLDGTPGVTLEDLFAFLGAWHVGCP